MLFLRQSVDKLLPTLGNFCSFTPFLYFVPLQNFQKMKQKNAQRNYHFTYSQISNKCGGQRFFLNLTKRGSKQMWGSEFFNETLIILLLLFDVREQLLIRKKKAFLFFKIAHVTKIFWGHSGSILTFFPYQQPKRKSLKDESCFTYVCQQSRPQDVQFLQYCT